MTARFRPMMSGALPGIGPCLLAALLAGLAVRADAVERTLTIEAPATAPAGQPVRFLISAGTDAGAGERLGFLQAEFSIDGDKTWTAVCYLTNIGPSVKQPASITPGPPGSTVHLRVRAAFRDGLAGDVDFSGAAIRWHASWAGWDEPPARHAWVKVTAP